MGRAKGLSSAARDSFAAVVGGRRGSFRDEDLFQQQRQPHLEAVEQTFDFDFQGSEIEDTDRYLLGKYNKDISESFIVSHHRTLDEASVFALSANNASKPSFMIDLLEGSVSVIGYRSNKVGVVFTQLEIPFVEVTVSNLSEAFKTDWCRSLEGEKSIDVFSKNVKWWD